MKKNIKNISFLRDEINRSNISRESKIKLLDHLERYCQEKTKNSYLALIILKELYQLIKSLCNWDDP